MHIPRQHYRAPQSQHRTAGLFVIQRDVRGNLSVWHGRSLAGRAVRPLFIFRHMARSLEISAAGSDAARKTSDIACGDRSRSVAAWTSTDGKVGPGVPWIGREATGSRGEDSTGRDRNASGNARGKAAGSGVDGRIIRA